MSKLELIDILEKTSGYYRSYLETLSIDDLNWMHRILQVYPKEFFYIN